MTERHGRINDEEMLKAINQMTFDHGNTEVIATKRKKQNPGSSGHSQSGNLRTRRVQNAN